MLTKTQAIIEFLKSQPIKVDLYHPNLEVQVKALPGPEKERTKTSIVWSDGNEEWSSFRIPFGSFSDAPTYQDSVLNWSLYKHAEAVGLTGWDWFNRCSRWVGFDFDSITNHVRGLNDSEMDALRDAVSRVPWITLRRSKSGKGFHLYVFLDPAVPTVNHTEHAALARAVLNQLSGLLSIDFSSKVDVCGHVLWVWHREATKEVKSFELIKEGTALKQVPPDWRELVGQKRSRSNQKELNQLFTKTKIHHLDSSHQELLQWFASRSSLWWWDAEKNMLVCHTVELAEAHKELKARGLFSTLSKGKDTPNDQNCFLFPLQDGGWIVRRHGLGTPESSCWFTDSSGWTTCYFNRQPDINILASVFGGTKMKSGGFVFEKLDDVVTALSTVNIKLPEVPKHIMRRKAILSSQENELILSVERHEEDDKLEDGWYEARGPKWERVIRYDVINTQIEVNDDLIRHVSAGSGSEWWLKSRDLWVPKDKGDIKDALISLGFKKNDLSNLLGQAVLNHWELVNLPFREEYPGNRQWNRTSAQLAVTPRRGTFEHWNLILNHIGEGFGIEEDPWCQKYNILTGGDYLKLWIACLFKYPYEPLPYLFLYGDEESGKSILHEAMERLFKNGIGYAKADTPLTSEQGFNGELFNAVLCIVEEVDLKRNRRAIDRIKDWVTGRTISIHFKGRTIFGQKNTTHWLQCANQSDYCPVFPGDTRISVSRVGPITAGEIPKPILLASLLEESGAFLEHVLNLDIPNSESRLKIPAIRSSIKEELQLLLRGGLEEFLENFCEEAPGCVIELKYFTSMFCRTLMTQEQRDWTPTRISRSLPLKFPRGRYGGGGQIFIGNIKLKEGKEYRASEGRMVRDARGCLVKEMKEVLSEG